MAAVVVALLSRREKRLLWLLCFLGKQSKFFTDFKESKHALIVPCSVSERMILVTLVAAFLLLDQFHLSPKLLYMMTCSSNRR